MAHVGKECPRAWVKDLYVSHNVRDPVPRKLVFVWTTFGGGTIGANWVGKTIVSAVQQVSSDFGEYQYTFENPDDGTILTLFWTLQCTVPAASNGYHCTPYWRLELRDGTTLIAIGERRITNAFPLDTFPDQGENMGLAPAPGIPTSTWDFMGCRFPNANWEQQPEYRPHNWLSDPGTEDIRGNPIP